jgi:hypothetical protein
METAFRIMDGGQALSGPVELPALIERIKKRGVKANSWIFSEKDDCWRRAADVPELQMFFPGPSAAKPVAKAGPLVSEKTALVAVRPGSLRRVKALAEFTDEQLIRFASFMEVLRVQQWHGVVRQGQPGQAMYMVLGGELRVRVHTDGKETTLATLGPGDFFGEISLFDHGPRSADVLANQESLLLKISSEAFQKLISGAPDLAAPFLFAMARTLTARIRADNRRYCDSLHYAHVLPPEK